MLTNATDSLIKTARDQTATDAEMNASAQSFFDTVSKASRDDANGAIRKLSEHFGLDDANRAAFLALVCGALVESGCDPLAIAKPLIKRLESLLKSAAELAKACLDKVPASQSADHDPIQLFEEARKQISPAMPKQNMDWKALELFWRPAIAVFSCSSDARASAVHLRELATVISQYHEAGHWLELMLGVLNDEPILAIEPQTSLGILGRISGVVDNFQLNVLLMDAFPKTGFFARRRVPKAVADIARGNGPQQSQHVVTSNWNLYTWQAIQPSMTLPDPGDFASKDHWIWNEGNPADIPTLDGRRIILLGPASYPRSWQSQRMFDKLPAKLEIERKLTKDQVNEWMQRMISLKNPN